MGALRRRVRRYAEGGDVPPAEPQDDNAVYQGALSGAGQQDKPDAEGALANLGPAVLGSPDEVKGYLSGAASSSKAARDRQLYLIQQAMGRLPSPGSYGVNLPLMAFATGLGARGGGFNQGFENLRDQTMWQAQNDQNRASAMNNLGLAEGQSGVDAAKDQMDIIRERLGIGERAAAAQSTIAQRRDAAAERAAAASRTAAEVAQRDRDTAAARAESVDQRRDAAEQGRFQFLPGTGPDPKDPSKDVSGIYTVNTRTGDKIFEAGGTLTGRGGAGARTPAFVQSVQWLSRPDGGMFPHTPEGERQAGEWLKSGAGSSTHYASIIEQEKRRLSTVGKYDPKMRRTTPYTEAELDAAARQSAQGIMDEAKQQSPMVGAIRPGAVAPAPVPAMLRQAAPAGISPPPGKTPPRPTWVPAGSAYSAKTGKWWSMMNGKPVAPIVQPSAQ